MASNTIREFLVALGFKVDEGALGKFTGGISKATKSVFALAAAIETTATLVAAGIAKYASNLEALYFAAQRTGSSASQLKAFDLAARNLGANAGEAQEAIEGLAQAFRTNPGNIQLAIGLLSRLGLQLKVNANGTIDSADALLKLVQVFKTMPYQQAALFAEQLKISERTLNQLVHGDLLKEYQHALKEVGPEWVQASKDAHTFMQDLRDLETVFEAFGLKVEHALQKKLGHNLKDLTKWLQVNGPWLADRITTAATDIVHAAEWIIEKVKEIITTLKDWDRETDGLSTRLIALAVLLKVTGVGSIIGGVLSLAAAFVRLGTAMTAINATASVGLLSRLLGPIGLGVGAGWALDKVFPNNPLARFGNKVGGFLFEHEGQNHLDSVLRFFRDRGWSAANAAGIVANLIGESSLNPHAEKDGALGLAQWRGTRLKEFSQRYHHDIQHSSEAEQLDFVDWELRNHPEYGAALLKASTLGTDSARIVSRLYERPGNSDFEQIRRARIATSISPQTSINIYGGSESAAKIADRVAAIQKEVNAELARNFTPTFQ